MIGKVELWVALAAWAAVLGAMARHVVRTVFRAPAAVPAGPERAAQ
jgi:hypothetical protein